MLLIAFVAVLAMCILLQSVQHGLQQNAEVTGLSTGTWIFATTNTGLFNFILGCSGQAAHEHRMYTPVAASQSHCRSALLHIVAQFHTRTCFNDGVPN